VQRLTTPALFWLLTPHTRTVQRIQVLVELGKTQDNSTRKLDEKALMLLGEILHLSDILMPASQCANIQVSPTRSRHRPCACPCALTITCPKGVAYIDHISCFVQPEEWGLVRRVRNGQLASPVLQHQNGRGFTRRGHSTASTKLASLSGNVRILPNSLHSFDFVFTRSSVYAIGHLQKDRRLDRIDGIKRKMDWDMDTRQLLAKLQNSGVRSSAASIPFWAGPNF
jgi:hypothetical protein